MRFAIVLCLSIFLAGCLDEDLYADGTPWSPVEERDVALLKNDSLIKHPYLRRMPTTEQEWTRFIQTLNEQPVANLGNGEETFTPTSWLGFSADPSGAISYMDLGELVVMWRDTALTGTSDEAFMALTGVPEKLWPSSARVVKCFVEIGVDVIDGSATISAAGVLTFGASDTSTIAGRVIYSANFTAAGSKGLPAGWLIFYSR